MGLLVRRRPAERELEVLEDRRRWHGRVRLDAEVLERRGQLVDCLLRAAVDEPREAACSRSKVSGVLTVAGRLSCGVLTARVTETSGATSSFSRSPAP